MFISNARSLAAGQFDECEIQRGDLSKGIFVLEQSELSLLTLRRESSIS